MSQTQLNSASTRDCAEVQVRNQLKYGIFFTWIETLKSTSLVSFNPSGIMGTLMASLGKKYRQYVFVIFHRLHSGNTNMSTCSDRSVPPSACLQTQQAHYFILLENQAKSKY